MSKKHYIQLSINERIVIENRLNNNESIRNIAKSLNRSPSTISREIRRNSIKNKNKVSRINDSKLNHIDGRKYRGTNFVNKIRDSRERYKDRLNRFNKNNRESRYSSNKAVRIKQARDSNTVRVKPLLQRDEYILIDKYIENKLEKRWSPEQIALRLKLEIENLNNTPDKDISNVLVKTLKLHPDITSLINLGSYDDMDITKPLHTVSYSTIYRHIKKRRPELAKHLRRYNKRYKRNTLVFNNTNRDEHSIHNRPKIVERLERLGDLEGDTIVGLDKKDRLLTHIDRVSKKISISLVKSFNGYSIYKQTIKDLSKVFKLKTLTITYDNGVEFIKWKDLKQTLNTQIFFADPYKSCQRGRIENANGLIRDYLPKKTDFKKLKNKDILKIQDSLNNRPRKSLNGLTPNEFEALHLR